MHVETLEHRTLLAAITPDRTFGENGQTRIDIDNLMEAPTDAVILPDGKILIGGWADLRDGSDQRAMLIRLNADGTRDTTFGRNGVLLPPGLLEISDLAVLADGSFVAAVDAERKFPEGHLTSLDVGVARFRPDGTFDESFGNRGIATVDYSDLEGEGYPTPDHPKRVVVDDQGRVVVTGQAWSARLHKAHPDPQRAGGTDVLTVTRFTAGGQLDTSFSDDGRVVLDIGFRQIRIPTMPPVFGPGGTITLGGLSYDPMVECPDAWRGFLARLNSDGTYDTSFHKDGRLLAETGSSFGYFTVLPDGGVVTSGSDQLAGPRNSPPQRLLVAYRADGSLNESFGAGGRLVLPGPGASGSFGPLWLGEDGTLIVFGVSDHVLTLTKVSPDGRVLRDVSSGSQIQGGHMLLSDGRLLIVRNTELGQPPVPAPPNWSNADALDIVIERLNVEGGVRPVVTPLPPGPDRGEPQATFIGKPVIKGGKSYTFRVRYEGIDAATLGHDDVVLSGPPGAAGTAQLVRVRPARRRAFARSTGARQTVVATYRVSAPDGGRFGVTGPAGQYTLRIADGAVATMDRVTVRAGTGGLCDKELGAFEVRRGRSRR
jgi:uncharacterized delta-60 repeat protein